MRTCMYCGKELKEGELCDCSASRARRSEAANEASAAKEPPKEEKKRSKYKTGYAGGDNRFERARDRYKAKRAARKNNPAKDNFFSDLWHYVYSVIRMPVQTVINPGELGKGAMLTIAAVMGAVLWLCMFFIMRGGAVGPLRLIASAIGFGGTNGYKLLASIGIYAASGAVGGIVTFFIYTGIFYFINRFIIRLKTDYWYFCIRLVTAWIPFALYCLAGTVLSFLSPIALMALVLCGASEAVVLTYEGLKTEWISVSPSKVMGAMALGYCVFFIVMGHLALLG